MRQFFLGMSAMSYIIEKLNRLYLTLIYQNQTNKLLSSVNSVYTQLQYDKPNSSRSSLRSITCCEAPSNMAALPTGPNPRGSERRAKRAGGNAKGKL